MNDIPYDAVLFDLDGTLTASEPGIINCVQYALEQMGLPVPPRKELQYFIGPPLMDSFLQAGIPQSEIDRAVALYRERFGVLGWKENSVYFGIPAMLRALKKQGAYVAVATAKPIDFSARIIEYFGLAPFIDRLEAISLDEHHASKSDIVRRALPKHYRHACMVGDRAGDMEGAVKNGIDGIGALYGYGTREELEGAGAAFIARDPTDLERLLLGKPAEKKGFFITFEGSDGCGKSTQAHMARDFLAQCGYDVILTREPGGCPLAERIRQIILDVHSMGMTGECEALLYAAARAQHVAEVIVPAVERGAIVLCDRFVDSSIAYQGAGRGLGRALVERINEAAVAGHMPDLTLIYDLPPMKALQRRLDASSPDRLELEKNDFVERVYAAYRDIAAANAARVRLIDGDRSIEEVQLDTQRVLLSHIAQ